MAPVDRVAGAGVRLKKEAGVGDEVDVHAVSNIKVRMNIIFIKSASQIKTVA